MTTVHPCHHPDFSLPALVFGGLLLATTAVCGTIEAVNSLESPEEVIALSDEFAIGPDVPDLIGMQCQSETKDQQLAEQCLNKNGSAATASTTAVFH